MQPFKLSSSVSRLKTSNINPSEKQMVKKMGQSFHKLKEIKTGISLWPTCILRKNDVIFTLLRIGHIRLMHRHLLLGENPPSCSHCHFSILIIRHLLTDCLGVRHLCRHYLNPLPSLKNLLGKKSHTEIINFLREANFYYYI